MGVPRLRSVALAAMLAALPVAAAGCSLGGSGGSGGGGGAVSSPTADSAAKARERVQAYLDAMKAKDVDTGRSQLCVPLHTSFDAAATGANGDFASHFTVTSAMIIDVRADAGRQQVSTAISVSVGKQALNRAIVFSVTRVGDDWCIAGEKPGGASPSPGGAGATPGGAETGPAT